MCPLLGPPASAYDRRLWTVFTNMNVVTSIAEGPSEVFVGTTGGVRRYDRFRKVWLPPITTADDLPDNHVRNLVYDQTTGDLWIDTPSGTARWMTGIERVSRGGFVPGQTVRGAVQVPPVITPFGYTIAGSVVRGPRRSYPVTDVLVDSWDVLWVGTAGLGVGIADLRFGELSFDRFGPLMTGVTALAADGNAVWFGGTRSVADAARGIARLDRATGTWSYFEEDEPFGFRDVDVVDILPDRDDVWFATPSALLRLDRRENRWLTYPLGRWIRGGTAEVTSLARDGDRLWIGTREALAVLDLPADTVRAVGGSAGFDVRCLAEADSVLWAATDRGLFTCRRGTVRWEPATSSDGLTRRAAAAVAARGDTVAAALSLPGGILLRVHPDSAWSLHPVSEVGGSRKVALGICAGRVWATTDQGVLRLRLADGDLRLITSRDGLPDETVLTVLLEEGAVWFGTRAGASRYAWQEDFLEQED